MMDIKVRIWDGNNGRFDYPDVLELDIGLEYQQYTGLQDRTGREIYEGDICNLAVGNGLYETGLIDFFQGCFIFISNSGMQYPNEYLLLGVFDGHITGNIHENPELLESERG